MFNRRNLIILAGTVAVSTVLFLMFRGGDSEKAGVRVTEGTANAEGKNEAAPHELFQQAMVYKKDGELPKAQQILRLIYNEYIDYENIEQVQRELEGINMSIIFSNTPSPSAAIHDVVKGDTLGELAKKYGTTIELIKRSNGLDSNIIRIGQKLRIWQGQFNIFVDKSQNILILKEGDNVVKVYNVSTGKNNSTPVGSFKVTTKLTDPVWFNKGVVVPPESPANVLGSRWLGFDIPGYGI
ncbi:MAG: LysM peptidoglycan-binding domain-containing protein, partial [Candidatus Omnitrophica bacterium]|nr:LysM peptidoglycan-binding domain-containing protein [Candidatus Omnitrophota bacterium]